MLKIIRTTATLVTIFFLVCVRDVYTSESAPKSKTNKFITTVNYTLPQVQSTYTHTQTNDGAIVYIIEITCFSLHSLHYYMRGNEARLNSKSSSDDIIVDKHSTEKIEYKHSPFLAALHPYNINNDSYYYYYMYMYSDTYTHIYISG